MDAFEGSGFGQFLTRHFSSFFRTRSWISFLHLAYGWSVCRFHHTVAQYIWLSGGSEVKHFTRYYSFLSLTFLGLMDQLWAVVLGLLDSIIEQDVVLELVIDDTTCKKSGRKIKGASWFRNGAGSARQEYRTLWGLNFVCISLCWTWRGHRLSLPLGLGVYLKQEVAQGLGRSFASRSVLGRQMVDFVARTLAHRRFLVLIDGGYATKEFLRELPENIKVLGRFPINSKLYELPPPSPLKPKAGRPPLKGASLFSPKKWKKSRSSWQDHPTDPQLGIRSETGIWHSVLPGVVIHVVAIWRKDLQDLNPRSKKKQLEAFFTTDLDRTPVQILEKYPQRWEVEITIRDANAFYGLAQDRCRNLDRIQAINSFRMLMATLRTIWVCQTAHQARFNLIRFRPWYRQKKSLTQLDIQTLFEELLYAEGIIPTVRFLQDVQEIIPNYPKRNPKAA